MPIMHDWSAFSNGRNSELNFLKVGNVNVRPLNAALVPMHSTACLCLAEAAPLRQGSANGPKSQHYSNAVQGEPVLPEDVCQQPTGITELRRLTLKDVSTKWIATKTCSISVNF